MPAQDNLPLIRFLNRELSNCHVLYVKLHRYHWYIQGTMFFELHAKFEEWYEDAAAALDEIAERILAIGGRPLATMAMFLSESSLEEATADDEPSEMLDQLLKDFTLITNEIHNEGMRLCEQQRDIGTADLLTRMIGDLEKKIWMLRSSLIEKSFASRKDTPVHS